MSIPNAVCIRYAAFDALEKMPPRQCKRIVLAMRDYYRDRVPPDFRGNKDDKVAFGAILAQCNVEEE